MKQNLLLCALLGILCVQVFVKPVSCKMIRKVGNDSDSDNDDDDEDTDNDTDNDDASDDSDEEEYQDPSEELNCILFDTSACNATCNMLGYLYGTDGEGTCDQELSCDCKIKQESDLTTLWDAKIQKNESSSQILSKINKDSDLSSRAIKTLQKFPRTNAQLLDEIKNEFRDIEGIDKLKILQDTSPVKKFIDDNDKVNEAELRTHISTVIQQALKDKKFTIGDPKYQAKLTKFFNNNIEDEVKEYIRDQVLKTDNAALKKLLTTGNTQNKYDFKFDKYASYDRIVDFVEAVVNDEFVKFVEASTKPSPRRTKSSKPKRPTAATRSARPPAPARPPTPTRPSSIAPKTSKKSEPSTQSDKANQWDTPIKILNVISKMRGEGHKKMSDSGVNVEFERDIVGNISLRWKNGNNEVHFDKDMNGAIEQLWKFGNVTISLSRDINGTLTEDWLLGQTEMKHYKSFMGHSNTSWVEDKEDSKSLEKYRKFIDSWCDKNYTLMKTRDCKIYDRNAY